MHSEHSQKLRVATGVGPQSHERIGDRDVESARECRQLCGDRPFGVNLTILPAARPPPYEGFVRTIIEERVPVMETAGSGGKQLKRIVQAASTFQIGDKSAGEVARLDTQCHHESDGPPLKSFLFDLHENVDDQTRFETYAGKIVDALRHVTNSFEGLRLQNRVAILVPDQHFLDGLHPRLLPELEAAEHYRSSGGKSKYAPTCSMLIAAKEASAEVLLAAAQGRTERAPGRTKACGNRTSRL